MNDGKSMLKQGGNPASGFTIMELMIAIAIIGILSAIAFPFYQEHINKARRAEAIAAITSAAAAMERYKASNNFSYLGACSTSQTPSDPDCTAQIFNGNIPNDGAGPFYTLTVEATPDSRGFVLTATTTAEWSARDGALQVDNTGAKRWQDKHGDVYTCFPKGGSASCASGVLLDATP